MSLAIAWSLVENARVLIAMGTSPADPADPYDAALTAANAIELAILAYGAPASLADRDQLRLFDAPIGGRA